MSTSWLCRSVRTFSSTTVLLERPTRGGRRTRLERVRAPGLAREVVLDEHHVVLQPLDDLEERRHRRDLLALLLQEPVHELLGDEIAGLARRDGELRDLGGDPLLLVERERDRSDIVGEERLRCS